MERLDANTRAELIDSGMTPRQDAKAQICFERLGYRSARMVGIMLMLANPLEHTIGGLDGMEVLIIDPAGRLLEPAASRARAYLKGREPTYLTWAIGDVFYG